MISQYSYSKDQDRKFTLIQRYGKQDTISNDVCKELLPLLINTIVTEESNQLARTIVSDLQKDSQILDVTATAEGYLNTQGINVDIYLKSNTSLTETEEILNKLKTLNYSTGTITFYHNARIQSRFSFWRGEMFTDFSNQWFETSQIKSTDNKFTDKLKTIAQDYKDRIENDIQFYELPDKQLGVLINLNVGSNLRDPGIVIDMLDDLVLKAIDASTPVCFYLRTDTTDVAILNLNPNSEIFKNYYVSVRYLQDLLRVHLYKSKVVFSPTISKIITEYFDSIYRGYYA